MGAVDYLKQLAKSISKTGSGELSGIFSDFAGTMGEVGDLAGQATRKKVANAAMEIIHGTENYKAAAKAGGEAFENLNKSMNDLFDGFVGGDSDAAKALDAALSGAQKTATGANAETINAFMGDEGIYGKYVAAAKKGLSGNDIYKAVTGNEKLGAIGGAYTYLTDPTYGSTRRKVAIGGAVAGAIGIRYLQGGTLTRKANGENDIAGVPFI